MSRRSPFPTNSRRARSPNPQSQSTTDLNGPRDGQGLAYNAYPSSSTANLSLNGNGPTSTPLSMSRAPSRSQTPNSFVSSSPPVPGANYRQNNNEFGMSPGRPIRSERRQQQRNASPSGRSVTYRTDVNPGNTNGRDSYGRDSTESTRAGTPTSSRQRPRMEYNPVSEQPTPQRQDSAETPRALGSVLAAFQSAGASRVDRGYENGNDRERERARRIKEKEKETRRAYTRNKTTGDIDAVLEQVREEWPEVVEEDFNPVTLALGLLDDSSVGRNMDSFLDTKKQLENTLRKNVDKHYQSFNAALPHHAFLLSSLGKAQIEISDARTKLQEVRDALGNKRTDLVQLWSRSQMVDEMLKLLDEIEYLKSVPDTLESLISEKRLLQASVLLVRSLKTIGKQDMLDIGAVVDLRSYLVGQESALRDILVEELHSHLYLKTFWCDTRWAAYVSNQNTLPNLQFDQETDSASILDPTKPRTRLPPPPLQHSGRPTPPRRLTYFLTQLALRPHNEPPLSTDQADDAETAARNRDSDYPPSLSASTSHAGPNGNPSGATGNSSEAPTRNPESDSFLYIETLLESLAVLGKLGSGLDSIAQRLPVEIYALVEATVNEVGERIEFGKGLSLVASGAAASATGRPSNMYIFASAEELGSDPGIMPLSQQRNVLGPHRLRLAALEAASKASDHEVLKDLFWTLYSKLDAVMQGLRVLYEVANRIGSRRDFKDSSGAKPGALFPLGEIWMPVQVEVRTLLQEYLADDDQGTASGRNPISSINEVLRDGRIGRDRNKPVFRFGDTDLKTTTKLLRRHEEELNHVLQETVPGLVSGPAENAALQTALTTAMMNSDDRFAGGASQHRLLLKPDPFHVSVLFQPTISFLDRIAEVLPGGLDGGSDQVSSAFLDEFVATVYLPQLEEKVTTLFQQAVAESSAFQEDPESRLLSPQPLVKASTQTLALINSLCVMLHTTPFHRENYSRLIISVMIQFYSRCSDHFRSLVSRGESSGAITEVYLSVPATWAQRPEIASCLGNLYFSTETAKNRGLCRQETRMEIDLLGAKTINKSDLIQSLRNVSALATLYQSLTWLRRQLGELKSASEEVTSPTLAEDSFPFPSTPITPKPLPPPPPPPPPPSSLSSQLQLPLSRAMASQYELLLKTFDSLSELILCTIRIDVRCRVIHFVNASMREGNYRVDHEAYEPEPHILDLNAELGLYDDCISSTLAERERRFILEGLGSLVEHLLVHNARHIRFANQFGIQKISRNILALQQNLKTLSDVPQDTDFERAKAFYDLFSLTPTQMIEQVKLKSKFSFEEYRSMLNLQCGIDQGLGDRASGGSDYNIYLMELHALAIDEMDEGSEP